MGWEELGSHRDPDNGTVVVKQIRRRPNHGTLIRYVFTTKTNRIFTFSAPELFDMADTFNDVAELIEKDKF